MITYDSSDIFIQSATTLKAKIVRIDAIMVALEDTMLKAAGTANFDEYLLDDGQVRIKTIYRTTEDVIKSIKSLEAVRQMYVNRLNGRHIRLVDGKNFIERNHGRI
ncbi:hypothetical protein LCGC14_0579500 [marine sediment metagenome]|uniref:Uncharacterized protein n=1 Tax=marine sediment metagenome TaxID=412755 RepID=A0A0F9RGW1_9ZZZZ